MTQMLHRFSSYKGEISMDIKCNCVTLHEIENQKNKYGTLQELRITFSHIKSTIVL